VDEGWALLGKKGGRRMGRTEKRKEGWIFFWEFNCWLFAAFAAVGRNE
jgi:hypothetical protein